MDKRALPEKIELIDDQIAKLGIAKNLMLEKALHSTSVDDIFKAEKYIRSLETKTETNNKTLLLDPMSLSVGTGGYLDKKYVITFDVLRAMANVPLVKAIIQTRVEQVIDFAQPQEDRFSPGFAIRPIKANRSSEGVVKLTKEQEKRSSEITDFILNCGYKEIDSYNHDNFTTFLKKLVTDSLSMDQGVSEFVNNNRGDLLSFLAVDGATIRIADTFDQKLTRNSNKYDTINGYLPFYVQLYMSQVRAHFYPWEMGMLIRNPQTNIYANCYGRSELEDLIQTVTSILNADQYNSNYFKVGSNPKGILKVTGNINQTRLNEFRESWQATMSGVKNAHRLPIIEADKMDFISTQQSNKDMEYGSYYEFLIKILCAVYKIDPSEIGFPMSGNQNGTSGLGGDSTDEKLRYSKEKGLKPLLRSIQAYMNKHIVSRIDENYEFLFLGLNTESAKDELDGDIQKVTNFMTVNEIRNKRGLKDIEGGDIILNPVMMQAKQMEQMNQQQDSENSSQYVDEDYPDDQAEENPFAKSLEKDINKLLTI